MCALAILCIYTGWDCVIFSFLKSCWLANNRRDRGGEGAGFLLGYINFSSAPVDMEKVFVELLYFSLKGGR